MENVKSKDRRVETCNGLVFKSDARYSDLNSEKRSFQNSYPTIKSSMFYSQSARVMRC
jgi:hypothetical protein